MIKREKDAVRVVTGKRQPWALYGDFALQEEPRQWQLTGAVVCDTQSTADRLCLNFNRYWSLNPVRNNFSLEEPVEIEKLWHVPVRTYLPPISSAIESDAISITANKQMELFRKFRELLKTLMRAD